MNVPHSPGRGPEIQTGGAWGNWVNDDGAIGSAWLGLALASGSAQLSARLGLVRLGWWRRSLDRDLDISTSPLRILGEGSFSNFLRGAK